MQLASIQEEVLSYLIIIFIADMKHPANNTFHQQYILCFTIVPHLVLKLTSYPLNRATSDLAPKRGLVCQQLIHHAQYQLISKHKQSIFDIRESWIGGAMAEEMHLQPSQSRSSLLPSLPPDWHELAGLLSSCNYFTSEAQHLPSHEHHDTVRFALTIPTVHQTEPG